MSLRLAYADPPYLGLGSYYAAHHDEAHIWDDLGAHRSLIARLAGYDGWAMSLHSPSLHALLPLCPEGVRVAAWVKPFASFKPNVKPAYAWEPVIFSPGRKPPRETQTVRDWLAESITMQRGLTGAKPRKFCLWVFDLLGAERGDTLDDLFPGTNAVGSAWAEFNAARSPLDQLPLEMRHD
jgi:hypothetical protein